MGKAGRFACIFVPMALTLASFIALMVAFSGQMNKNSSFQNDLFFFRAYTKEFRSNPFQDVPDVPVTNEDNKLLTALQGQATASMKDYYKVGLWNYCDGSVDDKGKETVEYCSPRQKDFYFNPIEVWKLNGTILQDKLGDKLQDGLEAYRKVVKFMYAAFIIAAVATIVEFVVGIFGIFSRWGSFATTIVSNIQCFFMIAAAATATAVYVTLLGVFTTTLKPYHITGSIGSKMMAAIWLAVAFSVVGNFFWTISICCCSGKSAHKKVHVEKTPYTYERVASPYLGAAQSGHQMHAMPASGHAQTGNAYEPFRH